MGAGRPSSSSWRRFAIRGPTLRPSSHQAAAGPPPSRPSAQRISDDRSRKTPGRARAIPYNFGAKIVTTKTDPLAQIENAQKILAKGDASLDALEEGKGEVLRLIADAEAEREELGRRRTLEFA